MEAEIEEKEKQQGQEGVLKLIVFVVGGLIALVCGGKLAVDNAITLAAPLGASQTVIGLTIVAIGTSLPEAVTSIMSVIKKKEEIAIGNIVGSNILNTLLILGVVTVITPLELPPQMVIDVGIMVAISILLFFHVLFRRKLDKLSGIILMGSYIAYFIFIYFREVMR